MEKIDLEEIINDIRCSTFHMSDEEAKPVIDEYLKDYPELLLIHNIDWYYKFT